MTNKPIKPAASLLRATSIVSCMTFLSRISGFLRDMLIAHLFGAMAGVDAFLVAFKIPNFLRRLFAEGAFSQAFVPILNEYRVKKGFDSVTLLVNHVSGALSSLLLCVTMISILLAPLIILIFAPGFEQGHTDRFALATHMLRITFPYIFFISLTAFGGAILNSEKRFAVPAFGPVLLNLSMIAAGLWWAPHCHPPVIALAWGVLAGGIIQWAFQLPFLHQIHLLPKPMWGWKDEGVRRILKLMGPAIVGVSVGQINLLVDTIFASFLPVGSVSWLYYSDRLTYFPLGVFGVAIATVILPHLSKAKAKDSHADYSKALDWALRLLLLIGFGSMVGLFLLSGPLLVCLFQYGKFGWHDVIMTSRSLRAFALGIPAFMLIKTLASAFYARQEIKLPVRIGFVAMIFNVTSNMIVIHFLAHAGLALSTALAAWINAGLLLYYLLKQKIYEPLPRWRRFGIALFSANLIMGLFLWVGSPPLTVWYAWSIHWKLCYLTGLIVLATVSYFGVLGCFGMRLRDFRQVRNF